MHPDSIKWAFYIQPLQKFWTQNFLFPPEVMVTGHLNLYVFHLDIIDCGIKFFGVPMYKKIIMHFFMVFPGLE